MLGPTTERAPILPTSHALPPLSVMLKRTTDALTAEATTSNKRAKIVDLGTQIDATKALLNDDVTRKNTKHTSPRSTHCWPPDIF